MVRPTFTYGGRGLYREDHAERLLTVKQKLVGATGDLDCICHLKHRLKSDAFFAKIPPLYAEISFFGALFYTGQGIELFEGEPNLIAVSAKKEIPVSREQSQCETWIDVRRETVVIGILD